MNFNTTTALTVHGIAEILAGLAMIFSTKKVFPFVVKNPNDLGYLGKSFGVAITALGITALLARNGTPTPPFILLLLSRLSHDKLHIIIIFISLLI